MFDTLANLENSRVATGLEKVSFRSDPTERAVPKNVQTTVQLHSFPTLIKICSKTFKLGLNQELPYEQAGFRKGRRTRDQTANIPWIIEKAKEFQKNIYFCFIDYTKAFVYHNKLWEILKEMWMPDHLTCLLKNLYASQEATIRAIHGTTSSKLVKEYIKAAYCHPVYVT